MAPPSVASEPMLPAESEVLASSFRRLSWRRLSLAFLLIPVLAPFYVAVLEGRPWAMPLGAGASYGAALLVGIPCTAVLIRWRRLQIWHFAGAGLVCALPVALGYALLSPIPHLEPFDPVTAASLLVYGMLSGLCFWLFAVMGERPLSLRQLFDLGPPG